LCGSALKYQNVYVFRHVNMRNASLKALRDELQESSRFLLGSTKVLKVGLGKTDSEAYHENLHLVSERMVGNSGLFFTNLPHKEVVSKFDDFEELDYARPGAKATQTFVVPEGPVQGPGGPFPHTLEPTLRNHGLPTKLNKGMIEAVSEHTVCKEGAKLSADQAALCRHFDLKMAKFKMFLVCQWTKEGAEIMEIRSDEDLELELGDDGDMEEMLDEFP